MTPAYLARLRTDARAEATRETGPRPSGPASPEQDATATITFGDRAYQRQQQRLTAAPDTAA